MTERAKEIALQEAYRLVPVRKGDRIVKMPAVQAVHRSQIALAAKGNGPAQRAVLRVVQAIEKEGHDLNMELLQAAIRVQGHRKPRGGAQTKAWHHLCGSERAAPGRPCDRHAHWRRCHVSQGFRATRQARCLTAVIKGVLRRWFRPQHPFIRQ